MPKCLGWQRSDFNCILLMIQTLPLTLKLIFGYLKLDEEDEDDDEGDDDE